MKIEHRHAKTEYLKNDGKVAAVHVEEPMVKIVDDEFQIMRTAKAVCINGSWYERAVPERQPEFERQWEESLEPVRKKGPGLVWRPSHDCQRS